MAQLQQVLPFKGDSCWTMVFKKIQRGTMKYQLIFLVSAITVKSALAQFHAQEVSFLCDSKRSEARIGFSDEDIPKPKALVNTRPLLLKSPGFGTTNRSTPGGSYMRAPGKSQLLTCGSLAMHFSSEFLNENPDGELGAMSFDAIEIYVDDLRVLERTGFAVCELGISRWEYFGSCPNRYTVALHIKWDQRESAALVKSKRVFLDIKTGNVQSIVVDSKVP